MNDQMKAFRTLTCVQTAHCYAGPALTLLKHKRALLESKLNCVINLKAINDIRAFA